MCHTDVLVQLGCCTYFSHIYDEILDLTDVVVVVCFYQVQTIRAETTTTRSSKLTLWAAGDGGATYIAVGEAQQSSEAYAPGVYERA